MAASLIRRLTTGFTPILLLSVVMLLSLYLLVASTQHSEQFSRLYSWLLGINVLGAVILGVLIAANLYRLIRNFRRGVVGSRITVRLVMAFAISALLPVSVVYYFSINFLHQGIDSWFDVRVEKALTNALDLSRTALDGRMRQLLRESTQMATELSDAEGEGAALLLNDIRDRSAAYEVTLFTQSRILAVSSDDPAALLPSSPGEAVSYIRQEGDYVGLDQIEDQGLFIRTVVKVPTTDTLADPRYVQSLYPVAEHHSSLAQSVQQGFAKYNELLYLREKLKFSFTLSLSLVLLLTLLTAVWAAFFSARRMAAPVKDLAAGTRAVAAGDYSTRLPPPLVNDELGFLVQSFNDMTGKVADAQEEVKRSQREAETQHNYLQTILGHLSSGVLNLDELRVLRLANRAASEILNTELGKYVGSSLDELKDKKSIGDFIRALEPQLNRNVREWREEVTLFGPGGRQVLMCRGAVMPGTPGQTGGYVVVFDDITQLIQAQRNAAWGEVARRLAHEIKNPLTPIKLSAERLRHKYLASMEESAAEAMDRYTNTIVQQVDHMKEMVDAFSSYARTPQINLEAVNINDLVGDVLELYHSENTGVKIDKQLANDVPTIEVDANQLRQVMHNMIKNAVEALEGMDDRCITVETRCDVMADCHFVELKVTDNGPGIPDDILNQMFEPYVTTKPKGTGLGLAIVKKIIEEHGGMLVAQNLEQGGASFSMRLPVKNKSRQTNEVQN